jgi:hypothetical protein
MPSLRFRVLVPLVALPAILAAQGAQDVPTFRSSVQHIDVDVLVTDKKGNAVRDLTLDDFTLLEDGKPQRIRNFSFVDVPIETSASRVAAVDAVEPDVTTNTGEGRIVRDAAGLVRFEHAPSQVDRSPVRGGGRGAK